MPVTLERTRHPVRRLRRALRHEIDAARDAVDAAPPDVHTARRHLKRARALVRLGQAAWPDAGRAARHALRDAGRALGGVRDTEARVEAVECLADRPETPCREALDALAVELRRERDRARNRAAAGPGPEARHLLRDARTAVGRARGHGRGIGVFEPGLGHMLDAGRSAAAGAWRRPDDPAVWHAVRKRAKDLRYAVEFMQPLWPPGFGPLADELHRLTDRLGDANDLTLVLNRLADAPPLVPLRDRSSVEATLVDARAARWRAAAPAVERLWAPPAGAFTAVLLAWAAGHSPA